MDNYYLKFTHRKIFYCYDKHRFLSQATKYMIYAITYTNYNKKMYPLRIFK